MYAQSLSESFIREFIDYIDVNDITKYGKLNINFIRELYMCHDLDLRNLVTYGNLK